MDWITEDLARVGSVSVSRLRDVSGATTSPTGLGATPARAGYVVCTDVQINGGARPMTPRRALLPASTFTPLPLLPLLFSPLLVLKMTEVVVIERAYSRTVLDWIPSYSVCFVWYFVTDFSFITFFLYYLYSLSVVWNSSYLSLNCERQDSRRTAVWRCIYRYCPCALAPVPAHKLKPQFILNGEFSSVFIISFSRNWSRGSYAGPEQIKLGSLSEGNEAK